MSNSCDRMSLGKKPQLEPAAATPVGTCKKGSVSKKLPGRFKLQSMDAMCRQNARKYVRATARTCAHLSRRSSKDQGLRLCLSIAQRQEVKQGVATIMNVLQKRRM